MKDHFPEVYDTARPFHDDWPFPFSLIPRRWTGLCLMMPPTPVCGNAEQRWIPVQPDYPLAPDAVVQYMDYYDGEKTVSIPHVLSMDPVHPVGQWSIQSFYSALLKRRIPCYFSFSKMLFGRRVHFNGPVKPDVTLGDWYWWIECSLTWTKPK